MTTTSSPVQAQQPAKPRRGRRVLYAIALVATLVVGLVVGAAASGGNSSELEDLQDQVSSQQVEIDLKQTEVENLDATVANKDDQIVDLQTQVASAQQRADKAEAKLKSREDQLEAREQAVKDREDEVADRERAVKRAEHLAKVNTIHTGVFLVNRQVNPGTYVTRGPSDRSFPNCYWARLSGTGGDLNDIIANGNAGGQAIVTISSGDEAFETSGCQPWHKIS